MPYQFALEHENYGDLAAGKVFYSQANSPFFPVRLTSEIFQRCQAIRAGYTDRVTVYDPCCGGGYLLGTLAFLHGAHLRQVIASDIDPDRLALAERNLSLLTLEGLNQRIAQIESMQAQFHKESHREALDSAHRLKAQLLKAEESHRIAITLFQADALDQAAIAQKIAGLPIDLVITDVPYGRLAHWDRDSSAGLPAIQILDSLRPALNPASVVAICADKSQKIAHPAYQRVDHFQMGKRHIQIFKLSA
jgi:hypothetical protein